MAWADHREIPEDAQIHARRSSRNIALDVLESLIEATYTRDRVAHLRRANLGIEKLRILLRLACDLRLLDLKRYEFAARALDETGRLVGGWIKTHGAAARGETKGSDETPA